MFVLGIVGSPAGGKSAVARRLAERGAQWINADLVARSVLEEPEIQQQLIERWGNRVTGPEGRIDRLKLAQVVFGDDDASRAALTYLEGVVHPRTRALIADQLRRHAAAAETAVVLEVPLLFESHWDQSCDEIWCVDADRSIRQQRAAERGWEKGELDRREAHQLPIAEKKRLSNFVILNNGSLEQLHHTVDRLWESFLARRSAVSPSPNHHCL